MAEDGSEGPRGRGRSVSRFEDPEDWEEDPLGIQAFHSGESDSGSASEGSDSAPAPRRRKPQAPPQRRARGGLSQQTLSIINDLNPHSVPARSSESEEEAAEEAKLAAEQEHVRDERKREEDRARARRKRAARKQPKKEEEDHFDAFIKILLLGDQGAGHARPRGCDDGRLHPPVAARSCREDVAHAALGGEPIRAQPPQHRRVRGRPARARHGEDPAGVPLLPPSPL